MIQRYFINKRSVIDIKENNVSSAYSLIGSQRSKRLFTYKVFVVSQNSSLNEQVCLSVVIHFVANRGRLNSRKTKTCRTQNSKHIEFYKIPIMIFCTWFINSQRKKELFLSRFHFQNIFCWKTIIVISNEMFFDKTPVCVITVHN